jgi:hypothetical protein
MVSFVLIRNPRSTNLLHTPSHGGEIYYVFGTLGQIQLPFRDEYDLPFSQLVLDTFAAFTRTYDPNPDASFLSTRGYTNTSAALTKAGRWTALSPSANSILRLSWPPKQGTFVEVEQCKLLGLALDYLLDEP